MRFCIYGCAVVQQIAAQTEKLKYGDQIPVEFVTFTYVQITFGKDMNTSLLPPAMYGVNSIAFGR